ncbi:DUF4169 family protein [Novosphingobium cyanobacteriorum]|uniref:DUF4169 family protein n=1 Tax=Novosphingobium cyanobacteriorum TaxID=3024215 RepID=A0ABT6CQR3_9SPHN|nr:DUF4169 family protein [Novosphingobium cyanobacteriorum]MDF8334772.1 DUF4169 family protein [Novosphingobium cyanobacteriorum]
MAEVINLRQARKAKARGEAKVQAAANRALHGRTKGERQREAMDAARAERQIDGAKRETDANDL